MIIRIFGEGQYEVADEHLDELNELDSALQEAVESADEQAFAAALHRLHEAVRRLGAHLPDDALTPSQLVLPDQDTDLRQVREMLSEEGLIPG